MGGLASGRLTRSSSPAAPAGRRSCVAPGRRKIALCGALSDCLDGNTAAAGRRSWVLLDVALSGRLMLDHHRLFLPLAGCTPQAASWGALVTNFPPPISSSRAPFFSKIRTPRFPLAQGFPTGSFLIRIPLIAPFTFHFWVSGTESKQAFHPTILGSKTGLREEVNEHYAIHTFRL